MDPQDSCGGLSSCVFDFGIAPCVTRCALAFALSPPGAGLAVTPSEYLASSRPQIAFTHDRSPHDLSCLFCLIIVAEAAPSSAGPRPARARPPFSLERFPSSGAPNLI